MKAAVVANVPPKKSLLVMEAMEKKAQQEPLPDKENVEEMSPLKRVVQLMKRYRDVCYTDDLDIAPKSIIFIFYLT